MSKEFFKPRTTKALLFFPVIKMTRSANERKPRPHRRDGVRNDIHIKPVNGDMKAFNIASNNAVFKM